MTQEVQSQKDFLSFKGGLNTEINELNFPDGFTTDEANYEILVDGSRRRRKGLANETSGGSAKTTVTVTDTMAARAYKWNNVGGDPNKSVIVFQLGTQLYIADDAEIVSGTWETTPIDVLVYASQGTTTTALTEDLMLSFSQGRGHLFVSGPYIKPFFIDYDSANTKYLTNAISVNVRDFTDIEDGTAVQTEPTGNITADHLYNLRNRGWKQDDIDSYKSDKSKSPMRAARWYAGYKRTYDGATAAALIRPEDGVRSWDSTKMDAEVWGNTSAPRGSMFLSPFNTTFGGGIAGSGAGIVGITTWSFVVDGASWKITVTTASNHGFSSGDVVSIEGMLATYSVVGGGEFNYHFNGAKTATTGTSGTTLVFITAKALFWDSWVSQYLQLGQVSLDAALARSNGTNHDDSFAGVEYHAGRIFYAGMRNTEFADWIMHSQIADSSQKYGKCFQEADPTGEDFNAITSADGGAIIIPGLSGVKDIVSLRDSLIILATEGIWEISGGQRGVFTADGYSVRKLSDAGCSSTTGHTLVDGALVYTGPSGLMIISPNEFTGLLEVNNGSVGRVQTLWNSLTVAKQERVQVFYDDALSRVYFMYGATASTNLHDSMLVFASTTGSYFKYTFNTATDLGLLTGVAISDADDTASNKKMKFIYQLTGTSIQVADFAQTSFDDFDGNNGPLPFILTGHDSLGDWKRRGQAPVITMYSKRTETGYTETGGGFDPVNESSTLLTARWDWTDDAISNKITASQEIYRHVRNFVPSGTSDVDGYPVVVTRNKIRGRGRSLQLRFDGATDKDSHILGFTINYKMPRD